MTHPSNDLKLGNTEKEEDFYRELDKKSLHQSCCTCQTLAIFFVGLLLILSSTIFFLYWQISRGGGLRFGIAQVATIKDLQNKLTLSAPDATGSYQLILSADELNTVMNEGLSISDFILKDTVVSINPNEILIYGNLVKPLNAKIVFSTKPSVENGKLVLTVTKITAGNITLPGFFFKEATASLNDLLDKKLVTFYNKATVTSVSLDSNTMIINGKTK